MAKDPAFLFYSQDFLVGTMAMAFDERGRYITLLCYIHQNGPISDETIRLLVGSFSDTLRLKFKQTESGLFYNGRLSIEVEKRAKFTESRILNGNKGGRPKKDKPKDNLNKTDRLLVAKPTENLIENVNESLNDNIIKLEMECETVYDKIITYLNVRANTQYRKSSKKTIELINARLNEKFTVEDFIVVIDKMVNKWQGDVKMSPYIRPETLFGPKFEGYLNQVHVIKIDQSNSKAMKILNDSENFKKSMGWT